MVPVYLKLIFLGMCNTFTLIIEGRGYTRFAVIVAPSKKGALENPQVYLFLISLKL